MRETRAPCLCRDGNVEARVCERQNTSVYDGEALILKLGDDHHQHSSSLQATYFQQDGVAMYARLNRRAEPTRSKGAPAGA